jgi:hypothetical protein
MKEDNKVKVGAAHQATVENNLDVATMDEIQISPTTTMRKEKPQQEEMIFKHMVRKISNLML